MFKMTSAYIILTNLIRTAEATGKLVDVSQLKSDGSGVQIIDKNDSNQVSKRGINKFPLVVSDNYASYRLAMDIFGPNYIQFANEYLALYGSGQSSVRSQIITRRILPVSPSYQQSAMSPNYQSSSMAPVNPSSMSVPMSPNYQSSSIAPVNPSSMSVPMSPNYQSSSMAPVNPLSMSISMSPNYQSQNMLQPMSPSISIPRSPNYQSQNMLQPMSPSRQLPTASPVRSPSMSQPMSPNYQSQNRLQPMSPSYQLPTASPVRSPIGLPSMSQPMSPTYQSQNMFSVGAQSVLTSQVVPQNIPTIAQQFNRADLINDTPLYAAKALKQFFSDQTYFGSATPAQDIQMGRTGQPLMDRLPYLKRGYFLKNSGTELFIIYIDVHGLPNDYNIRADDAMMKAFGGDIPAAYYSRVPTPITMNKAVADGLIDRPLNTYDTIRLKLPEFNPTKFLALNNVTVIKLNSYSVDDIIRDVPENSNVIAALNNIDVRAAMIAEYDLIRNIRQEVRQIRINNIPTRSMQLGRG